MAPTTCNVVIKQHPVWATRLGTRELRCRVNMAHVNIAHVRHQGQIIALPFI